MKTPTGAPLLQVAAKAVIVNAAGKVLIVREAPTDKNNTKIGYWGLVGGRLKPGEAFMKGLEREVEEESGLIVEPVKPLYIGEWRPVIKNIPHQIIAIFMLCETSGEDIRISTEHDAFKWIDPVKRSKYQMMEPDCFVVDMLVQT